MFKIIFIALLCLILMGCGITTTIIMPNGDTYVVRSKSDALVQLYEGDKKVVVDNRGRPSFLEVFFSALLMKAPDMNIHTGSEAD